MSTIKRLLGVAERRGFLRWVPTPLFLKGKFWRMTGKRLDLSHPEGFNEKIQKLKLLSAGSAQLPAYTEMADKLRAKALVAEKIGAEYVIPTLGVWAHFDQIPFDALPEQFVLKTNHDSGGVVICKSKSQWDRAQAKAFLERRLKCNYYWYGREPQYRDIAPKIFAEVYMADPSGQALKDYKVFCFHGEPHMIQVDLNRFTSHKRNLYTTQWERIPGEMKYPSDPSALLPKPENLAEMLRLSRLFSQGIPFLRVDFYSIHGKTYFGEFTFFPDSGTASFSPASLDRELGSLIDLSN